MIACCDDMANHDSPFFASRLCAFTHRIPIDKLQADIVLNRCTAGTKPLNRQYKAFKLQVQSP